ncbi:MAG: BACON domain-containing protein, partial [Melioribacteraceae bacterium]
MKIKRYTLNDFIIFLFIYGINSCDFFAPYDLEFVELSDEKINFGLFENEKQFVIAYADSFNVSWAITTSDSWITVTPTSGIINIDDPDTVTVKIDREKIKGRGAFTAKIEISFQDKTNSKSIDIFAEIKAMLSISTDSLRFGASDTLSSFM